MIAGAFERAEVALADRGVSFNLAAYRTALRDLAVPLTEEGRSWLDRHRLLRSPREHLVEAGILPKR